MKVCSSIVATVACLISAFTTLAGCNAMRPLDANKALAKRVYEEGLSRGVFTVPYTSDFIGHSGATTFTHEAGMAEARGWRLAFPDLHVTPDGVVAERDLVTVRWTARGTNTTMASLEARLDPNQFARVSRSAMVNIAGVREIQPLLNGDFLVVLATGARVPGSRRFRASLERLRMN
jgi:hypothetical protein